MTRDGTHELNVIYKELDEECCKLGCKRCTFIQSSSSPPS